MRSFAAWTTMIATAFAILASTDRGRAAALLFRESTGPGPIPGWDHVAFEDEGGVFESHKGYDYHCKQYLGMPFCWDDLAGRWNLVTEVNGVQCQHTVGSFLFDSDDRTRTRTADSAIIPMDPGLAGGMAMWGLALAGRPYPPLWSVPFLSPEEHKGGVMGDGSFTCVGLVEYCAEMAGHNRGQGFIPNDMEGPILTPAKLYWAVTHPEEFWQAEESLSLYVDPVDFVLTDPLGRRVGYTPAAGLLEEIPGAFYTGDGQTEQVVILDPLPGAYALELHGVGESALAILAGEDGEVVFEGHLAADETETLSLTVGRDALPGDADEDGDVDFVDYIAMKRHYGLTDNARWSQGNFDGDGDVDRADFLILKSNFGALLDGAAGAPEPSTALLLLLGAPFAPGVRSRPRRCILTGKMIR